MRLITALLATAALAAAAGPASASQTVVAPSGDYSGHSTSGATVHFTINAHWTEVQNFKLNGHLKFRTGHFGHSQYSYGHFDIHANGVHYWAAWDQHTYGYVHGGYSWFWHDSHGTRHETIRHWTAKPVGWPY